MTEKIYQKDAYLREWDAELIRIEDGAAVFTSTIFAPEAGGQPCDLGSAGGFPIVSVEERKGEIFHKLKIPEGTESPQPGQKMKMKLDWDRRFDHMQSHLGEHMLSGLFKSEYDARQQRLSSG